MRTVAEVLRWRASPHPGLALKWFQGRAATTEVDCRVVGSPALPGGGEDPRRDRDDAVTWQLYTSGTTGVPKGAMLSNRNLLGLIGPLGWEAPELQEGARV